MSDVWSNLLTVAIILSLIIIAYLKISKKTFKDLIIDIKAISSPSDAE